jgi:hypothetical protein
MDMNAIMKKLAARNQYQNLVTTGGSFGEALHGNTRYSAGAGNNASHHHQPSMSFAGKKITTISGSGHHNHQADATKRLSVNLNAGGFVSKVA